MQSWNRYESPQARRIRTDMAALAQLVEESSIFRFRSFGDPTQKFLVEFRGRGLARQNGRVSAQEHHEVEIKLGSSYPRTMPELRWQTPIYQPNISEIGLVCLGGYGTHWVPSLKLDALCEMLWDMVRYLNYDVRSPYNREAALWAAHQSTFKFPVDPRPLRDVRVAQGRMETQAAASKLSESADSFNVEVVRPSESRPEAPEGICILDVEVDLTERPAPPRPVERADVFFIE